MAYLREEIKAGAIILTSLVLLSGLVVLIGGSRFFEEHDTYYVKVYNSAGLEVGAQVRLGGVRIGRVAAIEPPSLPGEPVTVVIGVKKGTTLYRGTKAYITQVGFVGDIYLLLTVDGTRDERFSPGDVIPSEEQIQFARLMARMDELSVSLKKLIADIDRLFSPKNIQKFEGLLEEMNRLLASGSSNLDAVAASLRKTTEKIALVLDEIERIIEANRGEVSLLLTRAREGVAEAREMFRTMEDTAETIGSTTESIERAVQLRSRNLGRLIQTLTETTEDLQELLQELKIKPWSIIYREGVGGVQE